MFDIINSPNLQDFQKNRLYKNIEQYSSSNFMENIGDNSVFKKFRENNEYYSLNGVKIIFNRHQEEEVLKDGDEIIGTYSYDKSSILFIFPNNVTIKPPIGGIATHLKNKYLVYIDDIKNKLSISNYLDYVFRETRKGDKSC